MAQSVSNKNITELTFLIFRDLNSWIMKMPDTTKNRYPKTVEVKYNSFDEYPAKSNMGVGRILIQKLWNSNPFEILNLIRTRLEKINPRNRNPMDSFCLMFIVGLFLLIVSVKWLVGTIQRWNVSNSSILFGYFLFNLYTAIILISKLSTTQMLNYWQAFCFIFLSKPNLSGLLVFVNCTKLTNC